MKKAALILTIAMVVLVGITVSPASANVLTEFGKYGVITTPGSEAVYSELEWWQEPPTFGIDGWRVTVTGGLDIDLLEIFMFSATSVHTPNTNFIDVSAINGDFQEYEHHGTNVAGILDGKYAPLAGLTFDDLASYLDGTTRIRFDPKIGGGLATNLGFDKDFWNLEQALTDATNQSSHSTVPEPATVTLFGIGVIGMAGVVRRKKL